MGAIENIRTTLVVSKPIAIGPSVFFMPTIETRAKSAKEWLDRLKSCIAGPVSWRNGRRNGLRSRSQKWGEGSTPSETIG